MRGCGLPPSSRQHVESQQRTSSTSTCLCITVRASSSGCPEPLREVMILLNLHMSNLLSAHEGFAVSSGLFDMMSTAGMTVILKRKFSASQFWDDCRKHNVTVMQYIGETMRYLCNTAKVIEIQSSLWFQYKASVCTHLLLIRAVLAPLQKDNDKNHKVRVAIGNGIRTDVWSEFLSRFGDIKVRELYAATEGNIGFINYTSKIGAVGRVNFVHRVGGGARPGMLVSYLTPFN